MATPVQIAGTGEEGKSSATSCKLRRPGVIYCCHRALYEEVGCVVVLANQEEGQHREEGQNQEEEQSWHTCASTGGQLRLGIRFHDGGSWYS